MPQPSFRPTSRVTLFVVNPCDRTVGPDRQGIRAYMAYLRSPDFRLTHVGASGQLVRVTIGLEAEVGGSDEIRDARFLFLEPAMLRYERTSFILLW